MEQTLRTSGQRRTEEPGVLQSGLQRARDDLATGQQSLPPSFSVPLTLTFSGTRSVPSLNVSPEDGLHTVWFISFSQSSGSWILGLVFSDSHAVGFDSPASTSVSIYLKASFTLVLCVELLPGFCHPWDAPCHP